MLNFTVMPPAVESLMDLGSSEDSPWATKITSDSLITTQAAIRRKLLEKLEQLFSEINDPLMDVTTGVDLGIVDVKNLIGVYRLLSDFLEIDPNGHRRLVLYLPLQILPHNAWAHESRVLTLDQKRFVASYLEEWCKLLSICDARANFIDGNIMEAGCETEPVEMTVQAAQLIPELLAKGLITIEWLKRLINRNRGNILEKSIAEVYPVIKNKPQKLLIPETNASLARVAWMRRVNDLKEIERLSKNLSREILAVLIEREEFQRRCVDEFTTLIAIESLKVAGNRYYEYEAFILEIWFRNNPKLKDAIISLWAHLLQLNVISAQYLDNLNVQLPDLSGSFTQVKLAVEQEALRIENLVGELSFLYPGFILFGSHLKGYANSTSDWDVAVFAKPEITDHEKESVRKTLGRDVVIFDLRETAERFEITNLPSRTHILFGGALCGEGEFLQSLYERLLPSYLEESEDSWEWLEQMERDAIQYRLLHSGYVRFFPKRSELGTFHDPGFRRLATKIFLKRVFLPVINL